LNRTFCSVCFRSRLHLRWFLLEGRRNSRW